MLNPTPALVLALLPASALCQAVILPAGTPLPVRTPTHLPLRVGQPIQAELLYPAYADNQMLLPAHTVVTGSVLSLTPDRHRRNQARLRADFTPYRTPVVSFTSIQLPTGPPIVIATTQAAEGAPIYRVVAKPAGKGGFFGQYYRIALQYLHDTWSAIAAPGKGDRALQFLYSQLPYHPQRIPAETAWTVETTAPISLAPASSATAAPATGPAPAPAAGPAAAPAAAPWLVQAWLDQPISSEFSTVDQPIHATVAEPILNPDGSIAVPQGAILSGTVTQARPARHFDRAGVLRFSFNQLTLPQQAPRTVRTTLTGADSASPRQLAMDSEGQVKPKAEDKILLPALLLVLAARPLDQEHGSDGANQFGKDAVASNGLGLLGFIAGTAARQPNLAAGFGYFSAALAIYPRYIGKGAPVAFPHNTRIVLQTTPTQTPTLKSAN